MFERKNFHRNYLYLLGIVCGVILGRAVPGMWVIGTLLAALTAFLLYCKLFRETLMLVFAAAAGFTAVFIFNSGDLAMSDSRLTDVEIEICDHSAVGAAWNFDDLQPRRLKASYNGQYIQIYFPAWMKNIDLLDGRRYIVSGILHAPEMAPEYFMLDKKGRWQDVGTEFIRSSYRDFLQRSGVKGTLVLEKISPAPRGEPSFFRRICNILPQVRRALARKLDKNLSDPADRAIIGAVTLGLRHRLTGGEKQSFSAVGLAHLFSISGLHVGVLAALILLVMRPLPRLLHIPAIGTLICYVLVAGGNAPAVRAFVMVFMLVIFRGFFLRCRPLEVLSMICGVFLLINPFYLTDGGFLYSFVITAVLIKSSDIGRVISSSFAGEGLLIGELSVKDRLFARWRSKLSGCVFFAAAATAASSALTLFFQNMFFAGSMLVNLLALPILLPLYLLSLGKLLLPDWNGLWNIPLDFLTDYLKSIVELANRFAQNSQIMHISYLTVLLYTVLLLLFLSVVYHRKSWVVLTVILLLGFFAVLKSSTAPERVHAVIYGGRVEEPVGALILPHAHTMYVLNCSYEAMPLLFDAAAYYGISDIERVDFGRPVASSIDGLEYLQSKFPICKYRKSKLPVRSRVFKAKSENLTLLPGADNGSLSINELYPVPDMSIAHADDGSVLLKSSGKSCRLERTRYPRAYIIEHEH